MKYLMVHGTADDNVHYQQSMMFSRALEEADVLFKSVDKEKYFDLQKYFYTPNHKNNSSAGKSVTRTRLTGWWD